MLSTFLVAKHGKQPERMKYVISWIKVEEVFKDDYWSYWHVKRENRSADRQTFGFLILRGDNNEKVLSTDCIININGGGVVPGIAAAGNVYQLEGIEVNADREYDKFGNVVTKQSYYRTGGDVTVINRKEIEEKHYQSIEDAIKRVPGVWISGTGHHADVVGMTGAGSNYQNELSINGDSNVVILIDGVRLAGEAMGVGGTERGADSGAKVMLNMISSIDNVESIEVIKGASASIYGANATGGVINIITRKGTQDPQTSVRLGGGSWGKYNASLVHSGASEDGKTTYFVGINRERSGDTEYKDKSLGKVVTFLNSHYKNDAIIAKVDRDLGNGRSVSFAYSHMNSLSGNPSIAPDYATLDMLWNGQMPGGGQYTAPGYRNWYWLNALWGGYVKDISNRYNLTYTFHKDHDIPSFIRFYMVRDHVGVFDLAGNGGLMFTNPSIYLNPESVALFRSKRREIGNDLNNKGVELQLAKTIGKHNLITGFEYSKSDYTWERWSNNRTPPFDIGRKMTIETSRNFFYSWVQDKIEVNDKFTVTPGVRYSYYGVLKSSEDGVRKDYPSTSHITYNVQAAYQFNPSSSMYASISNVFSPVGFTNSYNEDPAEKLDNEKGMNYSIGLKKKISGNTLAEVNFSYLDMSNAIGIYPVWNEETQTTKSRMINARQKKQALNVGVRHSFNDNWQLGLSYAYVYDRFKGKNDTIDTSIPGTTVDDMINAYRPSNIYQIDLSYQKNKWYVDLWSQIMTGMNDLYYTDSQFVILGMTVNYQLNDQVQLYVTGDNLTNEAYETKARSFMHQGAYPQPSRSFTVGLQAKF